MTKPKRPWSLARIDLEIRLGRRERLYERYGVGRTNQMWDLAVRWDLRIMNHAKKHGVTSTAIFYGIEPATVASLVTRSA